jgi:hypothetical protein
MLILLDEMGEDGGRLARRKVTTMATTGAKFLRLNRTDEIEIAEHALCRIRERTGVCLSRDNALVIFAAARMVRPEDLFSLGYRPRYHGRRERGQQTWYFCIQLDGHELIAVIGEDSGGGLVWVTTYAASTQTELLRTTGYEDLPLAA